MHDLSECWAKGLEAMQASTAILIFNQKLILRFPSSYAFLSWLIVSNCKDLSYVQKSSLVLPSMLGIPVLQQTILRRVPENFFVSMYNFCHWQPFCIFINWHMFKLSFVLKARNFCSFSELFSIDWDCFSLSPSIITLLPNIDVTV